MPPSGFPPLSSDDLSFIDDRVEAPRSFVSPFAILSVAHVINVFGIGWKLFREIGCMPELTCPRRHIRDGCRVLSSIDNFEPADHDGSAVQQSLHLHSNRTNPAFQLH